MHLINKKWHDENRQFKLDFYPQFEVRLKVDFPKTDLCEYPRIESR